MTLGARRFTYILAILVFFLVAPLVVGYTLGYRWQGWPVRIARTGALVITSQPRATIIVNGRSRGATPRRIAGLAPGTYAIRLERDGYAKWEEIVNVQPNAAHVIGPVRLFPSVINMETIDTDVPVALSTPDRKLVATLRSSGQGSALSLAWPKGSTTRLDVSDEPATFQTSPRGQLWILGADRGLTVRSPERPELAWEIPAAQQLTWARSSSDQIWFGLRQGELIRFDALTQTEFLIAPAASFSVESDILWYTHTDSQSTQLFRLSSVGSDQAAEVAKVPGSWQLQPGPSDRTWWRNPDTRQAEFLTYNQLTKVLERGPFGRVDRMWWTDSGQPPIWQDGADLNTWTGAQPALLERSPHDYLTLTWLDAPHILLAIEPASIVIKSVSHRQGRQTILSTPLTSEQAVVAIEPQSQRLIIHDRASSSLWLYRWDRPAA